MKGKSGGFTLVELLVTMACSALIMFAAMTFLLICMRLDVSAQTTASQQGTARVVLSLLEDVTSTGRVERVETVGDDWLLFDENGDVILQYSAGHDAILTGGGNVLMEEIRDSGVSLDGSKLLTVSFQTNEEQYETAVYCRTSVKAVAYGGDSSWMDEVKEEQETEGPALEESYDGRYALLEILAAQYGSEGEIKGAAEDGPQYFSEWYIGGYEDNPGWNRDTPWCACFLSWAVAELEADTLEGAVPSFSRVDEGMDRLKDGTYGSWSDADTAPVPGDFIFFDWDGDKDPEHVGAVFLVRDGRVYSIEGNSGGKVAVHSYALDDPQILGYGQLKWNTNEAADGDSDSGI